MGELYVVGTGPGDEQDMTKAAHEALSNADVIVGYTAYLDLLKPLFPGKEFVAGGMKQETERCKQALGFAQEGKTTALVSSGDAGVYGMASPVLELLPSYPDVTVRVVPGVTAALSGAALLGAPAGHDTCLISLSDLLTPWDVIEKRLLLAAEAGFVITLYNPASMHRPEHLARACDILMQVLSPDTVCGIARRIGREGEETELTTLCTLRDTKVDMQTTVFIGTKQTKKIGDYMVTPRGYETCAS